MYPTVPSTLPGCVATASYEPVSSPAPAWSGVVLARPKSRILTTPSLETIRFSGFRSRWTMPAGVGGGQSLGGLGGDLEASS